MYPSVFFYLMSHDSTIKNPFKKAKLILTDTDAFTQTVWDAKSDDEILEAMKDNQAWQKNYEFLKMSESNQAQKNIEKFEKFIKPQLEKRNLI